jgi:hypothetical protein
MFAIKEISTGYWLTPNDTFIPWNPEAEPVLVEAETEAELEDKRDALNAVNPGRTGIFSSPRPH